MHIPDGYLSPTTCAVTYAAALPFWYFAFARIKRQMHTRLVPLLAAFSAFSFVIMMFNLPLPGGTTGHAVGMAIATIVLGPWASMVAISIALLIQAVFFGDGGITTFGANCLNMAVVGSLVAHWSYTLSAGKSAPESFRRIVAAGIAGYLAINVAAFLTAIEFGIQPMFFVDETGTPLYAPYPLAIAVPAMMIGHLSLAGLAELFLSAGLMAYLQRSNPEVLAFSKNQCPPTRDTRHAWYSTRTLWLGLSALMILSPLGLLAAGTAWGEWGADDFNKVDVREEIMLASGNVAPPEAAPQGLEHLAQLWTAPISDYAPTFLQSEYFGYMLSAMLGVGLILLLCMVVQTLLPKAKQPESPVN